MVARSRADNGMPFLRLLLTALAGTLVAARPTAIQRQLQQATGYPEIMTKEEQLSDACGIQDFKALLDQGENCLLSRTVVAKYEEIIYSFSLSSNISQALSMEIVFEPFEGIAALGVAEIVADGKREMMPVPQFDSGAQFIFKPDLSKGGNYAIIVTSKTTYSAFSLQVDMFPGDVVLNPVDIDKLKILRRTCCGADGAQCTGVLEDIQDVQKEGATCAESAGMHCSVGGFLTHIDLSRSNMKCSLEQVMSVFANNPNIKSFEINGNPEVSGRLDDPKILSIIKGWPKLKFLDFGNLPKLTGSLPQQCPPPLDNLEHLSIASTQVGGTIPACLLNTVHQLEISHSSVTGPLPAFEPTNQLRHFIADRPSGSPHVFNGPVPDFSQLPYLHFLSVRNNNFQGVAKLPDKLHAARFHGNAVTVIDLPKDLEQLKHITYLEFSHNQLTGNVPEIIARLPTLAVLQLNNNHLTSLPQSWVGMQDGQGTIARLHHLDVSHNKLAGPLPAVYGSLEYLRDLKLNDNQLSGDLGDFVEAIPVDSTLSYIELQNNRFSGSLFFPALRKLAVFSSEQFDTADDKLQPHVLDLTNNRDLGGTVNREIFEALDRQLTAKVNVSVDFRGTKITCTRDDSQFASISAAQIEALNCGGSGRRTKVSAAKAFLISFMLLLAVGCVAVGYLVYQRRRKAGTFSHSDVPGAATRYVSDVESERTNGISSGGIGGILSGKGSGRSYVSGLNEPAAPNKPWSFLPGSRKNGTSVLGSQKYVESTMAQGGPDYASGGWGSDKPATEMGPFSAKSVRTKPQLPVSAAQPRGGPVTDITAETASPMSDVSFSGNRSLGKDVVAQSVQVDDGDPERSMNVTFNAAYAPGEH